MKLLKSLPLYETQDYKIFKFISENREKNSIQVKRLARTIREYGNITSIAPILVNEKFEIIDGQHRLWAMELIKKESGVITPLHFIVRDGLDASDAMKLNAGSKAWGPDDYAAYHSKKGNKNYSVFINFRERYELNADVLMKYLAPNDGNRIEFQKGDFVVENESKSKTWCSKLEDLKIYYADHKHRSFALAFLDLVKHKDYSHERMLNQLEEYSSELIRIPLKNNPMRTALIDIYNKRMPDKKLFN